MRLFKIVAGCVLIAVFTFNGISQTKIILKKGLRRAELSKGLKLMPLFKNDTSKYGSWKNSCKTCSQLPADSIWEIDSIGKTGDLFLKHVIAYEYDTISSAQLKRMSKSQKKVLRKKWELDTVLYNLKEKKSSLSIYKKPGRYANRIVKPDELEGLRFAKKYFCDNTYRRLLVPLAILGSAGLVGSIYGLIITPHPSNVFRIAVMTVFTVGAIIEYNAYKVKTYNFKEWSLKIKN